MRFSLLASASYSSSLISLLASVLRSFFLFIFGVLLPFKFGNGTPTPRSDATGKIKQQAFKQSSQSGCAWPLCLMNRAGPNEKLRDANGRSNLTGKRQCKMRRFLGVWSSKVLVGRCSGTKGRTTVTDQTLCTVSQTDFVEGPTQSQTDNTERRASIPGRVLVVSDGLKRFGLAPSGLNTGNPKRARGTTGLTRRREAASRGRPLAPPPFGSGRAAAG